MSELTWPLSPIAPEPAVKHSDSLMVLAWRRFWRHRLAVVALGLLVLLIASAVLAPLSPYDPLTSAPKNILQAPSAAHWMGTDELGRDVLTRILYGGRISLVVGFLATLLTVVLGVLVGVSAGYYGGWVDNSLMRLTDAFLSFPSVFVLILTASLLRDQPFIGLRNSVVVVIVIIGVLSWMWPARLAAYCRLGEMIAKDLPQIYLYLFQDGYGISDKLTGYKVSTWGSMTWGVQNWSLKQ